MSGVWGREKLRQAFPPPPAKSAERLSETALTTAPGLPFT